MTLTFDVAVIGAGVAGLNAAATVATAGLSCVLLDPLAGGGELMNLGALRDCADIAPDMTGPDLGAALLQKAMEAGAELALATVTSLEAGELWTVSTDGEPYAARAVIIASGLTPGHLGVSDQARFEGSGISHCAACDGPLYQGQPVAVVGNDRWAIQEACELAATSSSVVLITQDAEVANEPGVRVVPGRIAALEGASSLERIIVEHHGAQDSIEARGLFIQWGRVPALDFVSFDLDLASDGRLRTAAGSQCKRPLLFTAGSVRTGVETMITQAQADGIAAAQAAIDALRG